MSLPVYTPPPREPVTWRSRRDSFALWRGTRPFWGGVWTIVAGVYLWSLTAAPIGVVVIQGVGAISAIVICLIYILLALVAWSQPQLRVITGGIVIVLALAAIFLTNLGGFIVGTLMGLHGGASMIAWKPFVQRWSRPTTDGDSTPVTVLVRHPDDEPTATDTPVEATDDAPAAATVAPVATDASAATDAPVATGTPTWTPEGTPSEVPPAPTTRRARRANPVDPDPDSQQAFWTGPSSSVVR